MCYYHPKLIEIILSTCYMHPKMIETTHTDTAACIRSQWWCLLLVVSAYVHYLNSLDTYTLCTVYVQHSVIVGHKRTNYMHAIACMPYSTQCDMYIHCLHATCEYLTRYLEQLYYHLHAMVKFKSSCTIM